MTSQSNPSFPNLWPNEYAIISVLRAPALESLTLILMFHATLKEGTTVGHLRMKTNPDDLGPQGDPWTTIDERLSE